MNIPVELVSVTKVAGLLSMRFVTRFGRPGATGLVPVERKLVCHPSPVGVAGRNQWINLPGTRIKLRGVHRPAASPENQQRCAQKPKPAPIPCLDTHINRLLSNPQTAT